MALAKSYPLLAAKLYLALGFRILEEKQSKYYDAALGHFEEAREILLKEIQPDEWEKVVAEVREKHSRKYGFMPGSERLAPDGKRAKPGRYESAGLAPLPLGGAPEKRRRSSVHVSRVLPSGASG